MALQQAPTIAEKPSLAVGCNSVPSLSAAGNCLTPLQILKSLHRQTSMPARISAQPLHNETEQPAPAPTPPAATPPPSWRAQLTIEERKCVRDRLQSAYQKHCPDYNTLLAIVKDLEEDLLYAMSTTEEGYHQQASQYLVRVGLKKRQLKNSRSIYEQSLQPVQSHPSHQEPSPLLVQPVASPQASAFKRTGSPGVLPRVQSFGALNTLSQGPRFGKPPVCVTAASFGRNSQPSCGAVFRAGPMAGSHPSFTRGDRSSSFSSNSSGSSPPMSAGSYKSFGSHFEFADSNESSTVSSENEADRLGLDLSRPALKRRHSNPVDENCLATRRSKRSTAGLRRELDDIRDEDVTPSSRRGSGGVKRVRRNEEDERERERRSREKLDWFIQIALSESPF